MVHRVDRLDARARAVDQRVELEWLPPLIGRLSETRSGAPWQVNCVLSPATLLNEQQPMLSPVKVLAVVAFISAVAGSVTR